MIKGWLETSNLSPTKPQIMLTPLFWGFRIIETWLLYLQYKTEALAFERVCKSGNRLLT